MTLTLPTPDAGDTARQRFALELLLQQPVPGPDQLLASRSLLDNALPDVQADQWRVLQAMPIAINADNLDIAIPSQWRDQEWQHLIDQLPEQHRTIRLHPAIEADLLEALHTETTETEDPALTEPMQPIAGEPSSAETQNDPATQPVEEIRTLAASEADTKLDAGAESFLQDFSPEGMLESDEDDDNEPAQADTDL